MAESVKVYVSYSAAGLSESEKAALKKTATSNISIMPHFFDKDITIVNETDVKNTDTTGNTYIKQLAEELKQMADADVVYDYGDWRSSREARFHNEVAYAYGLYQVKDPDIRDEQNGIIGTP